MDSGSSSRDYWGPECGSWWFLLYGFPSFGSLRNESVSPVLLPLLKIFNFPLISLSSPGDTNMFVSTKKEGEWLLCPDSLSEFIKSQLPVPVLGLRVNGSQWKRMGTSWFILVWTDRSRFWPSSTASNPKCQEGEFHDHTSSYLTVQENSGKFHIVLA